MIDNHNISIKNLLFSQCLNIILIYPAYYVLQFNRKLHDIH